MNDGSGGPWPGGDPSAGSGEERPARFAAEFGLRLPSFDGPLVAFDPAPEGAPGDPVYLGGDLHRVHPDASERYPGRPRDESLDEARIALGDYEHEELEVMAVEGVWCLALHGDLLDSASFFALFDSQGRLRQWLLLPPAPTMIGIGHLWLPSVPPPPGLSRA